MSRSVALAMSIALSRVINAMAMIVLTPSLTTTFGGDEEMLDFTVSSIGVWLSPLLLLVFADWLLDRRKPKNRPNRGGNR